MGSYWTYYLDILFLSYALRYPPLLVAVVVFFALRRFIPDPMVLLRTAGRIRHLKTDIAANPSNVTARRDLASVYLQRLRPRAALKLLDEARARFPDDPELLFLTGLARLQSGDAAGALDPLVAAVAADPRMRYGEPYLVAAQALMKLDRAEEAEDALERYVKVNSSSVEGFARLAMVRRRRADADGARRAIAEALSTYAQVPPGYRRRKELRWWFRAHLLRLGF